MGFSGMKENESDFLAMTKVQKLCTLTFKKGLLMKIYSLNIQYHIELSCVEIVLKSLPP